MSKGSNCVELSSLDKIRYALQVSIIRECLQTVNTPKCRACVKCDATPELPNRDHCVFRLSASWSVDEAPPVWVLESGCG